MGGGGGVWLYELIRMTIQSFNAENATLHVGASKSPFRLRGRCLEFQALLHTPRGY